MTPNSQKPFLIGITVLVAAAFIGLVDAVYLSANHYMGGLPSCTALEGCDEVASSDYATIGPIPVALLGALFYMTMLISGFLWLDIRKSYILNLLPYVTVPAFLFSGWLVYLMNSVIEAWCLYCLISAGTTTLIMGVSVWMRLKLSRT